MTKKILYSATGSPKDPGFDGIEIDGVPYKEHFNNKGIIALERVIASCHGCFDKMTTYSGQLQILADRGDRVVGCLNGGLLFGLASIQATQVSVPIFFNPTDYTAYQGFVVPSGRAVVAGVGVEQMSEHINSGAFQRIKMLRLAERVLNLESDRVNVLCDYAKEGDKLKAQLADFGIEVNNAFDSRSLSLVYARNEYNHLLNVKGHTFIWAEPNFNPKNWKTMISSEARHHTLLYNSAPNAQVYGVDGLAMMAAKIISLQRPDVRDKILKTTRSYPDQRDLVAEVDNEAVRMGL